MFDKIANNNALMSSAFVSAISLFGAFHLSPNRKAANNYALGAGAIGLAAAGAAWVLSDDPANTAALVLPFATTSVAGLGSINLDVAKIVNIAGNVVRLPCIIYDAMTSPSNAFFFM